MYYRRDRRRPERGNCDLNDSVIDWSAFREFMRKGYSRFIKTGPSPLLRHALVAVFRGRQRDINATFLALFSALEAIVMWHQRNRGLEFILSDAAEWNLFRGELESLVAGQASFAGPSNKRRRKMVYGKISELRRVPFGDAMADFRETYGVDLSDLWPLIDAGPGVSLSDIRNSMAHGRSFQDSLLRPLMGAEQHLGWTVERCLLAILGWPVSRSKVRAAFLAHNMAAMNELQSDRDELLQGRTPGALGQLETRDLVN